LISCAEWAAARAKLTAAIRRRARACGSGVSSTTALQFFAVRPSMAVSLLRLIREGQSEPRGSDVLRTSKG
jgi:hypothetical protein